MEMQVAPGPSCGSSGGGGGPSGDAGGIGGGEHSVSLVRLMITVFLATFMLSSF